jgi:hypothetical protein
MNSGRRIVRTAAFLATCGLFGALLSGCNTAPPEPRKPAQRPEAKVVGSMPVSDSPVSTKRVTGVYPTFATPLTSASDQMSDEEATSMQSRLSSLASARSAGTVSDAEYRRRLQELQALGEHHASDAEAAIAKQ